MSLKYTLVKISQITTRQPYLERETLVPDQRRFVGQPDDFTMAEVTEVGLMTADIADGRIHGSK